MNSVIVTGTDTNIGKTVLSALLMAALPEYYYWKPVQSGTEEGTDSDMVHKLSGCAPERILREAYLFSQPLSPHLAARLDGKKIDSAKLTLPNQSPLLVEGAGGLLVPLTNDLLYIDQFKAWNLPVLLACRSSLGTINHTLLSLEALRKRGMSVFGCVPIGEINTENEKAIEQFGNVKVVGRIPKVEKLNETVLRNVFEAHFTPLKNILNIHPIL